MKREGYGLVSYSEWEEWNSGPEKERPWPDLDTVMIHFNKEEVLDKLGLTDEEFEKLPPIFRG